VLLREHAKLREHADLCARRLEACCSLCFTKLLFNMVGNDVGNVVGQDDISFK